MLTGNSLAAKAVLRIRGDAGQRILNRNSFVSKVQ
jgi:hypothetical protein